MGVVSETESCCQQPPSGAAQHEARSQYSTMYYVEEKHSKPGMKRPSFQDPLSDTYSLVILD